MSKTYTFLNFILKPEESSLYHNSGRLDLGLKGLKILIKLVEKQGKVVSKDELIIAGWDKQIVTDGTLSKQIERIRTTLGENYPEQIFVETVHGIGYKFVIKTKTLINRKKGLSKWHKSIASISIIPILLLLSFFPFNQQPIEKTNLTKMPFNIAVIPAARGDDYMNQGGISYLSKLLGSNPRVYDTSPRSDWFKTEDKYKLAIELEDQKNLDYVLLVDIKEQGEYKTAALELKNTNQYKQVTNLKALSFKQLFAEINIWVLVQLKLENNFKTSQPTQNLSNDSYAVESFLRGKKESSARNYEKAIQFYKIAITQDPQFDLAILNMADSQIRSNDYSSAQAIITTLTTSKVLNNNLKLHALILQSSIYVKTDNATKAKPIIDKAIALAEKLKNTHSSILAYYYQGEMYMQLGELELSIKSTLKQKEIHKNNSNDTGGLMRIANNLAYGYYNLNQLEQAKQQIEEAITWFEKTNHTVGKLNSYTLLAYLQFDLAQYKQAEMTILKAFQLIDQVEDDYLVLNVLESYSYILLELGKHQDLLKRLKEIEELGIKMGVDQPKLTVLTISIELANRTKNIPDIQNIYTDLDNITTAKIDNTPGIRQLALTLLTESNFVLNKLDLAKQQIDEAESLSKNDTSPYVLLNEINNYQWMYKTGLKKQATENLKQLLNKLIDDKLNNSALTVAYLLLYFDAKNNFKNYLAIINQIKPLNPLAYPYLKYQAMFAAHNNDYFEASKLMQQMKITANDWWSTDDQLLLDGYFKNLSK